MDLTEAIAGRSQPPTPQHLAHKQHQTLVPEEELWDFRGELCGHIMTGRAFVNHWGSIAVFCVARVAGAVLEPIDVLWPERLVVSTFCSSILRWWWAVEWKARERRNR